MDRQVHHEGMRSGPSCEPSFTLVERPFTVTQARNQLKTSQEPLGEIEEETLLEGKLSQLHPPSLTYHRTRDHPWKWRT